ncbi:MAG: hypothetical protein ACRDL0_06270 [Thermoleophilaceae bacterium]
MKSILRRRPSPALVIACVALFVSLGGVSYGVATGSIDSRELKNNTIRSKDVRNNTLRTFDIRNNQVRGFDIRNSSVRGRDVAFDTLTGNDISEEDLGKVPSAATADLAGTAGTAGTAGSVGGVTMRKLEYSAEQGTGFVEILNFGGLRLEARCEAPGAQLEVRGSSTVPNAEVSSSFSGTDGFAAPLAESDGAGVIAFAAPGGGVVTVQGLAREQLDGVRGTTDDCGFFGVAQAG